MKDTRNLRDSVTELRVTDEELEEYMHRLHEVFDGVPNGKMIQVVGAFLNLKLRKGNSPESELFIAVRFVIALLEEASRRRTKGRNR